MTKELESIKKYIENTHKADVLLERENFLLVEWHIPEISTHFCLQAYPYGKTGMANNQPWQYNITDEQAEHFLADPDEAEDFFNSKHWYFHPAEVREVSFDDIVLINGDGIKFKDFHWFSFNECVFLYKRDYPENEACIGERDITANPPYIEFWSFYKHDKVIFDRKGLFAGKTNERNFHKLCRLILMYGFSTRDMS